MQIFGLVAFIEQNENEYMYVIVIVFFLLDKGHEAENLQKECFCFALPLPYGGLQWYLSMIYSTFHINWIVANPENVNLIKLL